MRFVADHPNDIKVLSMCMALDVKTSNDYLATCLQGNSFGLCLILELSTSLFSRIETSTTWNGTDVRFATYRLFEH